MSSKYDVVKLKVYVRDSQYYILSRFLLSKMLMFCKIPLISAVRISLDVKRRFVNANRLSITQEELEEVVQEVMMKSFGVEHTSLLFVITKFYMERIPLVILIGGEYGKTTLAQHIASKLNCNTVINTEILASIVNVVETHLAVPNVESHASPEHGGSRNVKQEWESSCEMVCVAVIAEIEKTVKKGGVVVIEGGLLNLALYLKYLGHAYGESTSSIIVPVLLCPPPFTECSASSGLHDSLLGQGGNVDERAAVFGKTGSAHSPFNTAEIYSHHMLLLESAMPQGVNYARLSASPSDDGGAPPCEDDEKAGTIYKAEIAAPEEIQPVGDTLHEIIIARILNELDRRSQTV